jgi:hypothetical protein
VHLVANAARDTGLDLDLLEPQDVAGAAAIGGLANGKPVLMDGADGRSWVLQRVEQDDRVLAFRFENQPQRGLPDWILAFVFYAAIALVIMMWLWPMTRDLGALERSTVRFGDRNWTFDAPIASRSPVYPLAAAFRRMAARIDGLIGSHKDMSNALSHEIRVSSVSLTKSQVVLLGDPNCKVPALIENETRSQGVIVGGGPFDRSFVHLTHLPASADVKPGQRVVTSDLSAIYPRGIHIGVVADAHPVESGLIQEADVKLAAHLSSLEEVWVLFP